MSLFLPGTVTCQVEYVSARDEKGKELQRFDALLMVRFNPKQTQAPAADWDVPWDDGQPAAAHNRTLILALEVDRGTEQLSRLYDKAQVYKLLHARGHYQQTLGGLVLPVFLVPDQRRAAQIATEWREAWPDNPGLMSTFTAAYHGDHGALWGLYGTMQDNPTKPTTLLHRLGITLAQWQPWVANWPAPVAT